MARITHHGLSQRATSKLRETRPLRYSLNFTLRAWRCYPARAPTAPTSKFWGVGWDKHARRWKAHYKDADSKLHHIGLFDTQEAAAHAVNAAIRRAGLEGRRKTNPVVDGQLVPKPPGAHNRKRRRDEPVATPSLRARRR